MHKKGKIITVVIMVIILIGVGIWFSNNQSNSDVISKKENESAQKLKEGVDEEDIEEIDEDDVKNIKIEIPTEESLDIGQIPGYNQGDNDSKKKNQLKIGGLQLPYKVPGTSLVIESIGSYTGPFIEDGSDAPVQNILAVIFKNNSDNPIQYDEITINVNDKSAKFNLSNLPSKTSVLALESTGKIQYSKNDKYKVENGIEASMDSMSLMKDKIKIIKGDDKLTVKNISNEDLGTVYVYYKNIQQGGVYLGGITYRTKFENVKKGKTIEVETSHFSKTTSEILMVDNVVE